MKKTVIGFVEDVWICGKKFRARIDTGAERSSIDLATAKKLGIGPVIGRTKVKSASGNSTRPIVKVLVQIRDRRMRVTFNLADRKSLKYKVLIGRNILKKGFVIDAAK